jgi:predicted nucleic acid-binding protein
MVTFFLDTSALVKQYVDEPGSQWIRSSVIESEEGIVFISRVTEVEVSSTFARRVREGTISSREREEVESAFCDDCQNLYHVIDLNEEVIELAKNLVIHYPLRAYDAIQLASAIGAHTSFVKRGLSPLTFVSADNRPLDVAHQENLPCDNPHVHP